MKRCFALLLALLLACPLLAFSTAAATPSDPLVALAREELEASLGVDTPGAAIAILRGGETLLMEGFGYTDISARAMITPETVFEIGDISSVFVALAAYRLVQDGLLSLDATIDTYLPGEICQKLDLKYPVTTKQLLLGTAGFEGRTFDNRFTSADYGFETLEEALLSEVPKQVLAPGEVYSASPFGIALAALVVEHAADMDYAEYVSATFLEPLGMKNTVLNPNADTVIGDMACGHVKTGEGHFAVEKRMGRSYAGLYPANGALSTAADLTALLSFLVNGNDAVLDEAFRAEWYQTVYENGIFEVSAPALLSGGDALGTKSETLAFGASLFFNIHTRAGAFVLTNAKDSALLGLPELLCGATAVASVPEGGTLPELKVFRGTYADMQSESDSFVGRMDAKEREIKVKESDDGTLTFGERTLVQIAPCVFADAADPDKTPVLQFLLDAEGEVTAVLSADGTTYLPVPLLKQGAVTMLAFILTLVLSGWFLVAGIYTLLCYFRRRGEENAPGLVFTLTLASAAITGLSVLLQILVGHSYGGMTFASFFRAMGIITMLFSIGGAGGLTLSFATSLTKRGGISRVARYAALFLLLLLLASQLGLSAL